MISYLMFDLECGRVDFLIVNTNYAYLSVEILSVFYLFLLSYHTSGSSRLVFYILRIERECDYFN